MADVRSSLKSHGLTFTEIAKIVGERWQNSPAEARENYQRLANIEKEKYYAKMAEYKKSPEYDAYQKYLEEFKTKHAASSKGSLNSGLVLFRDLG
jgi:poly-D-alanine transfer protein DltD